VKEEEIFSDFEKLGRTILDSKEPSAADVQKFRDDRSVLEEKEFREGTVDQLSEKVEAHLHELGEMKFRKSFYGLVEYNTWQEHLSVKTPSGDRTLIVTNQAWCGGVGYGVRNMRYHIASETCFLYGKGNIGSQSAAINYEQSNVYGKGLKLTPMAGIVVYSKGAEVGLKLPIIWFDQTFPNPSQAGYKTQNSSPFLIFASVYAKWPIGPWFLQSDIGPSFKDGLTLWTFGVGRNF
jgi:hypothetical protein